MLQPIINSKKTVKMSLDTFGGLNPRDDLGAGELYKAKNICTEAKGKLQSCKARTPVLTSLNFDFVECMILPQTETHLTSFTGIASKDGVKSFYFKGTKIGDLQNTVHSVVDFSGLILIFPEKLYYSYRSDSTGTLKSMEQSVTNTFTYTTYYDLEGEIDYSTITKTSYAFPSYFSVGDSILISGTVYNNTKTLDSRFEKVTGDDMVSVVVDKVETGKLTVSVYNKKGSLAAFTKESLVSSGLKKAVPDLSFVCIHNNRLWGVHAGDTDSGSTVGEYIYASALGDPLNFTSFRGLDTDSWWTEIASPGAFTGIMPYENHVLCFKKDLLHEVYGTSPSNFSVPYASYGGCLDIRSAANISGAIYYLSDMGVMKYTGTEPILASEKANISVKSGSGASYLGKYYLSCQDGVYTYRPDISTWLMEENEPYDCMALLEGVLYAAKGGIVYSFLPYGKADFYLESCKIPLEKNSSGGINKAIFTLELKNGGSADIYISVDEGDFIKCASMQKDGYFYGKAPIRLKHGDSFRYKISGSGEFTFHGIEVYC